MEAKEIIKQFVLCKDMGNGRESCLIKALEDSRRLYHNEDLWARINANKAGAEEEMIGLTKRIELSFLSLIGYLILLDLIGEVFTEKKKKEINIISAINNFGSSELKKCKYIVNALRNSLAHNYGLVNVPDSEQYDEESLHKFTLSEEINGNGEIFKRKQKWKRENWMDKNEDTSTIVNTGKLIREIEILVKNLQENAVSEELSICLDGKIDELYARFTIIKC